MVTMDRISLLPNLDDAHLTDPNGARSTGPSICQPASSFAYGRCLSTCWSIGFVASAVEGSYRHDGLTILGRLLSVIFDQGTVLLAF